MAVLEELAAAAVLSRISAGQAAESGHVTGLIDINKKVAFWLILAVIEACRTASNAVFRRERVKDDVK